MMAKLISKMSKAYWLLGINLSILMFWPGVVRADVLPLTITSVAVNNSSAKVVFQPVPGAQDYRMYDITSPTNVKYAGIRHIDLVVSPMRWLGDFKLKMQSNGLPVVPLDYSTTATGPQVLDFP